MRGVAIALVALGFCLGAPTAAHATVFNVVVADGNQDPTDALPDNDYLWAYTTADIAGGIVCVHPAPVRPGAHCNDKGTWGESPVPPATATFTPISAPPLPPGQWQLLAANDADDPDDDATSVEFTVTPCEGGCPLEVGPARKADFEQARQVVFDSVKAVCTGLNAVGIYQALRAAQFETEMVMAFPGGPGGTLAVTWGRVVEGAAIGIKASARLVGPTKLGKNAYLDWAAWFACQAYDLAKKLSGQGDSRSRPARAANARLDATPSYEVVPQPDFPTLPSLDEPAVDNLGVHLAGIEGNMDALELGWDRMVAAGAAGAHDWEHAQARAIGAAGLELARHSRRAAASLRSFADVAAADSDIPDPLVTQQDIDEAQDVRARVRASGLTADEIADLKAQGGTDADVDALRTIVGRDVSDAPVGKSLPDLLRDEAQSYEDLVAPADALGREAAAVAGRTNHSPHAAFSVTGVSGPAPQQATFTDESDDPDHDPLTVTWDFGDGAFGAGSSPSHTYLADGDYTVTQTVSDGYTSVQKTKTVTVGHVNQPPTASFTATPTSGPSPLKVDFDASGSSDPDGAVAGYHWEFGDGATADGVKVSHTYQDVGGVHPSLVVTDDAGSTAGYTLEIDVTKGNRPPEPADDTLAAEGAGALDVLENDADPDKDALRVVATGAPAHGTASCAALGGCLYTPTAGYAGTDSFTYRVADPEGLEATAHVTVDVTTAPAPSNLLARADHAATRQGTAVTVHVLANDSGTGLHLTDATDPAHGTVACENDGSCLYTPSPGYSGSDGFSYTVANADGDERSADVEIAIAPSTAGYGVKVGGAPAAAGKAGLVEGHGASWGAAVAPAPAGVTDEALAAVPLPAVTAELAGAHALKPSSVRTARGWTAEPVTAGAGTLHAKAGSDALLGEVSDAIPRPLPAIGQGTGGDGHVPILVGSKVFAFFHHSSPTQVTCVDRATGSLCPGYPKTLNQATTNIPGPAVVVGTRIYVHLSPMQFAAQRTAQALYCWDAAKDRTCGLIVVDRLDRQYAYASPPVLIGGKLYFGGDGGRLYCVDPATNAACAAASLPTGLGPDASEYDIVGHGSRVYLGRLDGLTACIDVTAAGPCPGWALPRQLAGQNLVTHHNTAGTADGVCSIAGGAGQCYTDSAPAAAIPVTGWPGTEDYYSVTAEAEIGKRTLMAAHGRGGLGCWDWTTMAPCTGGDYVDGWIDHDTQSAPLPMAYGATYDGSCVVGLGDPGLIFTVDPAGHAPCTSLGAGTEPRTIDLRDQRCDNTVGGATWQAVALADSAPGELAAVTVTVRDAATGALLATKDITGSKLDLSGIDPKAHPAITVAANAVSTSGDPAWADSVPPRIRVAWKADPKQLCFETTTQLACASPLAPIGVNASIDGSAAKDEETLDVVRGACPAKPTPTPKPNAGGTAGSTQQSSAADLVRACTSRGVVLEDVIPAGNRVKLLGVAEERFKGRRVDIVFAATGKVVARPTVGPDGSFAATAPMPPRRLRSSNRARYQARVGGERSLNLKLMRRMLVTSVRTSGGKVTIAGKVIGPLALRAKDREIVLERRVTCTRLATVSRFRPRSSGAFKVTVPVPAGTSAAVYRLRTKVRASTHSGRLSSTFTLPRAIGFR